MKAAVQRVLHLPERVATSASYQAAVKIMHLDNVATIRSRTPADQPIALKAQI